MIRIYTQPHPGQQWLDRYRQQQPLFACILGFTATGLIPNISAAGATPEDRQYTAIADAEFLYYGSQPHPRYPLPPLEVGVSPAFISRAIIEAQQLPIYLLDAGLPQAPAAPAISLGGTPARCLSSGAALDLVVVEHLLNQGLQWGKTLAAQAEPGYLILSECVVGGTTTALAVLTGLGFNADGNVNSSHPICNHAQKWQLVQTGLAQATLRQATNHSKSRIDTVSPIPTLSPLELVAAVGDPMQIVVAGMAIAASRQCGVLLAGGTQMLAVYALARAIVEHHNLAWNPDQIVIGTTRWVVEDQTADAVALANSVGNAPLMTTQLSFATSRYAPLQAYEQGYVKEGVGAGGCAIAAHLYQNWDQTYLLNTIESLVERHLALQQKLMNPLGK